MSLTGAVDAAIAFVDDHRVRLDAYNAANPVRNLNDPMPDSYPQFDVGEFERLSRIVLVEAEDLRLADRLPRRDDAPASPGSTGPDYLGQVNLPGYWLVNMEFLPRPGGSWRDAMLTLRALAEHKESGRQNKRTRTKRGGGSGSAAPKIVACLLEHHQYAKGSCLNQEPIGVNELADKAEVAPSSVTYFFNKQYGGPDRERGHAKYKVVCRDTGRLGESLMVLAEDFCPFHLYGRNPPNEGNRDEDE
jgi:hypothetical protein